MAFVFSFLLATTVLVLNVYASSEDATVEIESGVLIRGSQMATLNQRKFFAFRGIPYAEPPVGKLRFRPPVRKNWKEKDFDASEMGPWCVQYDLFFFSYKELIGQEDCLTLNVYTHNTAIPLRKVMVFIHGGGFLMGSSNQYGPRRLLDRNVVLVTINYRLGPLGFLSTMDEASPGNYALLDQTEALKWVNRNIAAFGGDPNSVTIFGESAGSASVMNHLISPLSSGLFQRAIAQSGSVLNYWAEQTDPMQQTKLLAKTVGCDKPMSNELVDCLRGISTDDLRKATNEMHNTEAFMLFGPVADGNFHSQLPSKLLRNGLVANKVPLLMGVTKDEGLLFIPSIYSKSQQFSDELVRELLAKTLDLNGKKIPNNLIQMIKKEYFTEVDTKDEKILIKTIGKVSTDGLIVAGHYDAAHSLLQSELNVFLYSHDYITNHSALKAIGLGDHKGVAHVDDLFCLFDAPQFFPEDFETPNDETENRFLDIWTNFAEYGYPFDETADGVNKWKLSTTEYFHVYHMDKETKMRTLNPKSDSTLDFWLRKVPLILNNDKRTKNEL